MRVIKLKGVKRINGLHYAPDGRLLVVPGPYPGQLSNPIWIDVLAGEPAGGIVEHADCYTMTPDRTKLILGTALHLGDPLPGTHYLGCLDLTREAEWVPLSLPDSGRGVRLMHGVACDPTGTRVAVSYSLSDDDWNRLAVIPLRGKRKPVVREEVEHFFDLLAFSPDGDTLAASGGHVGTPRVALHSSRTLRQRAEFIPSGFTTRQLLYSPGDGELAVVNDKKVYLLPAGSAEPRLTLAHPKQVNTVAFSPDGERLVSACQDKLVRVRDVKTGELLRSYDWQVGPVTALAFAPDGLTVAAGGTKGRVVVWDWE